ncbi:DUF1292 domain-containing protein [Clostridium sp.]|uniref:DUF1292 domain-containing protein n=1 Tax=Clostridium sp. TaxID=1506 RepID=UPI002FC83D9C
MDDRHIITLTDPDTNEKLELEIIEELTVNGKEYALLAPLDNDDEAFVYRVVGEGADASYEMVEDEEEFDSVVGEYDRLFDEEMEN